MLEHLRELNTTRMRELLERIEPSDLSVVRRAIVILESAVAAEAAEAADAARAGELADVPSIPSTAVTHPTQIEGVRS